MTHQMVLATHVCVTTHSWESSSESYHIPHLTAIISTTIKLHTYPVQFWCTALHNLQLKSSCLQEWWGEHHEFQLPYVVDQTHPAQSKTDELSLYVLLLGMLYQPCGWKFRLKWVSTCSFLNGKDKLSL